MNGEKKGIRERVIRERDLLAPDERRKRSLEITARLSSLGELKRAKTVLLYHSFRSEVETEELIKVLLVQGKTVALPLVKQKSLSTYEVRDLEHDLRLGRFGIKEPVEGEAGAVPPDRIDLVIVPGVAFDEKGHRLGWGAGYYDRFLKRLPTKVPLIALAFELQVVDSIPAEPHDMAVDKIVTEKRVIQCRVRS
jgi:5-formyltetrahydrofolate cyclo-ligase